MSLVSSEEELRDEIIKRVTREPNFYRNIDEVYQSDPKICLATLLSYNYYDDEDDNPDIHTMILHRMPNFADHKPAFLRFMQRENNEHFLYTYMMRFRPEIEGDREFLEQALENDCFAAFFQRLSPALRMDVELLKLAVENIRETHLRKFVRAVPPEALLKHQCILFRALERGTNSLHPEQIPPPFWENRDFILKWTEKERTVSISSIPREFINDREICLSLYRSQSGRFNFDEIVDWIAKPFFADRSFVLECLDWHPRIFLFCDKELQDDFEVLLAAFVRATEVGLLRSFMDSMGESVVSRANVIHSRLEAHDEFMTFLACFWKGSKLEILPLSTLDCDGETERGLKTMIAKYLAFPGTKYHERLKTVWDELVQMTVKGCNNSSKLVSLIPQQTLVQSVLKAIECGRPVSYLQSYPDELWSYRVFVKWASKKGIFSKSMPDEFSKDPEICLAYYESVGIFREHTILPWISESLMSDRDFVLECAKVHPAIIDHCKAHNVLYDFEVLLAAVRHVIPTDRVDLMARDALEYGYGDAMVFFAKTVRAKVEAHSAFEIFGDQVGAHYFGGAPAIKPLIGSYLGIVPGAKERDEMQTIWNNRAIFCLALGGSVEELSKTWPFASHQQYRPNKRKWVGLPTDDDSIVHDEGLSDY